MGLLWPKLPNLGKSWSIRQQPDRTSRPTTFSSSIGGGWTRLWESGWWLWWCWGVVFPSRSRTIVIWKTFLQPEKKGRSESSLSIALYLDQLLHTVSWKFSHCSTCGSWEWTYLEMMMIREAYVIVGFGFQVRLLLWPFYTKTCKLAFPFSPQIPIDGCQLPDELTIAQNEHLFMYALIIVIKTDLHLPKLYRKLDLLEGTTYK